MINFSNSKKKRTIAGVIIAVLVVAMIVPLVISAFA